MPSATIRPASEENLSEHLRLSRAECDSNANLSGAPSHVEGQHAIESDHGQQQRKRTKGRGQRRHQSLSNETAFELAGQCPDA